MNQFIVFGLFFLVLTQGFRPLAPIKKRCITNFFLKNRFKPVKTERTITVSHNSELFNKLNGTLYSQIGSNPKYISDHQSYSWLDGDGMTHTVFFDTNYITYQNKWVETKRLKVEKKHNQKMYLNIGGFSDPRGLMEFFLYIGRVLINLIPFVKGTANTALFTTNDRLFALHEGDLPYELSVDRRSHNITTKSYLEIPNAYSITAHPAVDAIRNRNYLCSYNNYDFIEGKFIFNAFDKNMTLLAQKMYL